MTRTVSVQSNNEPSYIRLLAEGVNRALAPLTTRSITASETAALGYRVYLCNATGGAITLTLPPALDMNGSFFHVKKIDSSGNSVTLDGNGSETIDGATTLAWSTQWQAYTVFSNGLAWYIL